MNRHDQKIKKKRLVDYDCCGAQTQINYNNVTNKCCCHCNIPVNKCDEKPIETDVIIVGSGMAGTMAMLAADREGAKVIMLESESSLGGTTLQSGSTLWIPNLSKTFDMATAIKNLGIPLIGNEYNRLPNGFDTKEPAMEYMASCVQSELYTTENKYLGLPANTYHLISLFYDDTKSYLEDEILPYIDSLRVKYNEIKGTSYKPMTYNTNMHALQSGFTLTQSANETFTASTDPVIPDTFGQIDGYCYSVTDTPGYFSMEPDYYDKSVKTGTCVGRQIQFVTNNGNGTFGDIIYGGEYLKRIWNYLQTVSGQQILTNRRVVDVEEKEDGTIVTVLDTTTNKLIKYKAKKGIVFGSGGFSHNNDYIMKHLMYTQILGSCSSNGCRGDLVDIAEKNKWELTQMKHAFFNQQTLNDIGTNTQSIQWFHWFSTAMVINKFGNRVYAETAKYNERAKVQFAWDATKSYYNQYLFMVMDRSEYNRHASSTFSRSKMFSVDDNNMDINDKIPIICEDIKNWFASLSNLSEFKIDDQEMSDGFIDTLAKYQSYCSTGLDLDFQRQNNDSGRHWLAYGKFVGGQFITKNTVINESNDWRFNEDQVSALYGPVGTAYFNSIANYPYTYPDNRTLDICPDITLQPIIDPVVVVIVPTTLDTKGGPLINEDFKIAYSKGSYVAGNAGGSSFTALAYFGAGGTLGPALFGGWKAGKSAANNDYSKNEDDVFSNNLNIIKLMNNDYPDRTISLNFSDPIDFIIVVEKCPKHPKVLFKLSESINESISAGTDTSSLIDWLLIEPVKLNSDNECYCYYRVVLPANTFSKSGNYLVTFQMVDSNNKSLGPKYADQNQITVTKFNNVNNYKYIGDKIPDGSLLLSQIGGFWTGKNKVNTLSGFPEVIKGYDIYIKYTNPSHNFNLTYAYQFNTYEEVVNFGKIVYSQPNGISYDASILPPLSPSPIVNLPYLTTPWFTTHYDVVNNNNIFPNNEVSTFAYISYAEKTKNWFYNTAYTEPGKYTVYFYYCAPHRTSSIHIGWFAVLP